MVESVRPQGFLRVVSPQGLAEQERAQAELRLAAERAVKSQEQTYTQLAGFIRTEYEMMRIHRNGSAGHGERMLQAQRVFNGKYTVEQLAEIRKFGGSEVYPRIIALKCRGASALLREVYLGAEKPWGLDPTPEPDLPDNIQESIKQLVAMEVQSLQAAGQPFDINSIKDRINGLIEEAKKAAKKKARKEARVAESMIQDRLVEGGFYTALAEFIQHLPLFPFACIKGPEVRIVPNVVWGKNGQATTENRPQLFWRCVSPFDIYFTPGVSKIEHANMIERVRYTRADLNEVLGLPGYNEAAVRAVLQEHGQGGLRDWLDSTDTERAQNEGRESPTMNRSGMIDGLEFHGSVQGSMLLDWGMDAAQVPDPDRDYFVQCWLIGQHVIKVQMSPSPRKRHPYFITSFEKVPGTVTGNALPDILEHIENVAAATLRSLVNNMSISSGPQVVVNDHVLAQGENGEEIFPWKRWHLDYDPMNASGSLKPVEFFQPASNAQELLGIYEKLTQFADELSAIPRYITGSDRMGGAGRTASGLAMLMGNASKILQTVAANIDRDVISPCLQGLYDLVMLTDDSGFFRGDENISVRGVDVAVQRETNRQRSIELLQATANPIDYGIMGMTGRATLLRGVVNELDYDGENIVPSEEELEQRARAQAAQAAQAAQMAQQGAAGPGAGPPGQAPAPAPSTGALGQEQGNSMRGMV